MPGLKVEHVYQRYPREAFVLKDIDFCLPGRELVVLYGLQGSGKTTLLKTLAGIMEPSMGEILLDEEPIDTGMQRKGELALISQQSLLYPKKSVYDNLTVNLKKKGLTRAEIRERAEEAAEQFGIGDWLQELPGKLDTNRRRLVMLAKAYARRPKLVLADEAAPEPMAGMKSSASGVPDFLESLQRLYELLDAVVIYATGNPLEAWQINCRTLLLEEGELIRFDTMRDLNEHLTPKQT